MINGLFETLSGLLRKRDRGNHEYRQLYISKQQSVEGFVQGRTL
jgi:hypothetical protein